MYHDIHTGIGSAILTMAALVATVGQRKGKRTARHRRRRAT
jgi:hypothetical protein